MKHSVIIIRGTLLALLPMVALAGETLDFTGRLGAIAHDNSICLYAAAGEKDPFQGTPSFNLAIPILKQRSISGMKGNAPTPDIPDSEFCKSPAYVGVATVILPLAASSTNGLSASSNVTQQVAGWTVHIRQSLLDNSPQSIARAMELLAAQLQEIRRVVPKAALVELQKVPLWMSPEYPGDKPCGAYHPNVVWLREHGRDPTMAKSIEFTNVRIFDAECRRMPVFVLHELAHAYHDRVLGYDHAGIQAAYARAKVSGIYDRVQRQDSEGRLSYDRAYALKNEQEFFAETTEAFFGRNDMQPFTRDELEKRDPETVILLKHLWKVNP